MKPEIKSTDEIIGRCIEYKKIIFTNYWSKTKNKKWISLDSLKEITYEELIELLQKN